MKAKTKLLVSISLTSKECKSLERFIQSSLRRRDLELDDDAKVGEDFLRLLQNPLNHGNGTVKPV